MLPRELRQHGAYRRNVAGRDWKPAAWMRWMQRKLWDLAILLDRWHGVVDSAGGVGGGRIVDFGASPEAAAARAW